MICIKMKCQKIINLLGNILDNAMLECNTKKWVEPYDKSGKPYNTNKEIRFKTSMLPKELCDYR